MNYTGNALALIKRYTPFYSEVYLGKHHTQEIGFAHTVTRGERFPKKPTEKEGESILRADLEKIQITLSVHVHTALNQNQYDALTSFVFSIGEGEFRQSNILQLINKHRLSDAAKEFLTYNRRNGKLDTELSRRREEEQQLFNS